LHQRALEEMSQVSSSPAYSKDEAERVKLAIRLLNLALLRSFEINGAKYEPVQA
jgi:hypothetical protein